MMKTYLVGGCIRDHLLELPVTDRDWVVVGSTVDEMLSLGYQAIGKDFPVFLHPDTHEEYALARTERKTAPGYKGFVVHADPDVTLEQDLLRRDLTINAIAQNTDGSLFDPFNGQQDLKNKTLRHVSPAFVEDPVRVLRLARFAARFDFDIADETKTLVKHMIANKELEHLVAERVWQELAKALKTDKPSKFFTCLRDVGALKSLFPEIDRLFAISQVAKWHREVDIGTHTMMVIDQSAQLNNDLAVRFAALCHNLGTGTMPKDILPRHIGHDKRSINLTKTLCQRLRIPSDIQSLSLKVAEFHGHMYKLHEMKAASILNLLENLDAFRRPRVFEQFLLACEAIYNGKIEIQDQPMPTTEQFKACFNAASKVIAKPFFDAGLQGKAIANAIRKQRIETIEIIMSK